jgi:hypothetical protein
MTAEILLAWVRPPSLGRCFRSAQEIAFRHDANEHVLGVNDWQPADLVLQHQAYGLKNAGARFDRQNLSGHDIFDLHNFLPSFENI